MLALLASITGISPNVVAVTAAAWRVGTGRALITPAEPLWMTGYAVRTRPGQDKAQDLWAKALAFSDPAGNRGVLVTVDLCGITREMSDRVALALERKFQLSRSAVMTNASHTHCSPAVDGYLVGLRLHSVDDQRRLADYRQDVEARMIAAATQALESLAPATLAWSEDAATFGINRRNNSAPQLAALSAAGKLRGPTDPRVPVLVARAPDGRITALLASYACHNTTLSFYSWHGDYAGSAQEELERRHPGATVLYASGCGADINPFPRGELGHAEAHGRSLADAVDRALAREPRPITGRFASAFGDIMLSFSGWPSEEALRDAREKDQPNKEMYQAWEYAVTQDRTKRGDAALQQSFPVQAWRLGDLSWVALGGEPVVDYALRLRQEFGSDLWVLGYSTDVMCYIPSERVLKEGRYEGDTSMIPYGKPSRWAPGLEERIVTKAHELLHATRAAR